VVANDSGKTISIDISIVTQQWRKAQSANDPTSGGDQPDDIDTSEPMAAVLRLVGM